MALSPGHVRLDLAWGTLSLGDAWRPLLAAALAAGVRHAVHPRPNLLLRLLAVRAVLTETSIRTEADSRPHDNRTGRRKHY